MVGEGRARNCRLGNVGVRQSTIKVEQGRVGYCMVSGMVACQ